MLKSQTVLLTGRDEGRAITLRELPALVADRYARAALAAAGCPVEGGVVSLALKHYADVRAHPATQTLLQPFVGDDILRDVKDWRNVDRLVHAALLLHVEFLFHRETLDIPVTMQAQAILAGTSDIHAHFCSPAIAGVLHSRLAGYRELETTLSTEDVYNLVELINVESVRDWTIAQKNRSPHT